MAICFEGLEILIAACEIIIDIFYRIEGRRYIYALVIDHKHSIIIAFFIISFLLKVFIEVSFGSLWARHSNIL